MKSFTLIHTALLLGCLALVSCQSGGADQGTVTRDEEADLAAIAAQSRLFSQAYVDGDLTTQMGIYADDAVIAPPGRGFISGADLGAYWAPVEGRAVTSHRTIPDSIVIDGTLAYDWGRYEGASGPVGSPSEFRGKYLIVWRLDDDGVWRMVQDMWNSGPAQ